MIACGLDFGTSNSAIGIARGDAVALAPLEDDKTLMPSAVFFDYEAQAGCCSAAMPSPPMSARPRAG